MSKFNVNKVKAGDLELKEKVVAINRVVKTTKGGRAFSFSALVVVGNENGVVGHGLGKAKEVQEAITKGIEDAKKNLIRVPVMHGTIPHDQFAKEGAAKADAVEPADEVVIVPDLDTVSVSEFVEPDIEIANALVDPGIVAARLRRGATCYHSLERAIDRHGEGVGTHGAPKPRRDAKTFERYHAAHLRLDPEQGGVVGALGHREDSAGVSAQQHFGSDVGRGVVA